MLAENFSERISTDRVLFQGGFPYAFQYNIYKDTVQRSIAFISSCIFTRLQFVHFSYVNIVLPGTCKHGNKAVLVVRLHKEASRGVSINKKSQQRFIDYVTFRIPEESSSDFGNCIGIARGFTHDLRGVEKGYTALEAILLSVPECYHCVDLSLYKESQIVLLLNETTTASESSGNACMMIVQASDLPFVSVARSASLSNWKLLELKDSIVHLQMESEKVRGISHSVISPLAVSASRGVACVFAARKRALVYILDEDEDDVSDAE